MSTPPPSHTAEIETLRAAYAALNRNDIPAMVKSFDPQIEWTEPAHYPGGGTVRGRDAVEAHLSKARQTWAEGGCEPERFVVAGDKIVVFLHVHVRAKTRTEWVDARHAAVYTFRDGKATHMRIVDDPQQAIEWAEASASDAR